MYRRARVKAAEAGKVMSALVRRFLDGLGRAETEVEHSKRAEASLRAQVAGFRAGDRLPRDEVHERRA